LFKHFVPSVKKLPNARCKKTMLAAVQDTDEGLIARGYLMQICAHLVFSYTKRVLLVS